MDVLKELVTILGGTAIAAAAMAWLAKSLLTHLMSKDLEKYRTDLSARNALEMERLRGNLMQQALEHEVKFRRVDEKVAEHLAELYRRLFRLYETVSSLVQIIEWSTEPSKEDKLNAASKANQEFWDYFLPNRVYVPPRLYERVKQVAGKLADVANEFTRGARREQRGRAEVDEDHWSKAFHTMEQEATPLFTALVAEVQKRLGVEDT